MKRKPSPQLLLLALAVGLAAACMGEPATLAPTVPEVSEQEVPVFVNIPFEEAAAGTLSRFTGTTVMPEDVLEMGKIKAYRMIFEFSVEEDLERLEGLEGEEADALKRSIENRQRTVSSLLTMEISQELGESMPPGFALSDQGCDETPQFSTQETSLWIERPLISTYLKVYSSSSHTTSHNAKHGIVHTLEIRDKSTGEIKASDGRNSTRAICDQFGFGAEAAIFLHRHSPGIENWCAEARGEHRAWNDADESVETETRNPYGCVDLVENDDPTDPGDITPKRVGGSRGGG